MKRKKRPIGWARAKLYSHQHQVFPFSFSYPIFNFFLFFFSFFNTKKGTILSESQREWLGALGELTSFATMEDFLFRKVALNSCINPVAAIFDIKNGEILDSKNGAKIGNQSVAPWEWVVRLAKEAREVMKKERPQVDLRGLEEEVEVLIGHTKDNINSMLVDVRAGSHTEIDFINGAIVDLGKKHGVPTPANEEIIQKVKQLKKDREERDRKAKEEREKKAKEEQLRKEKEEKEEKLRMEKEEQEKKEKEEQEKKEKEASAQASATKASV
jgi:hypothetical protein